MSAAYGDADAGAALHQIVFNQRLPIQGFVGPQRARIVEASEYRCYFVIGDYSPDYRFGPAPYPRAALLADLGGTNAPAIPPVGTNCLAVFVGSNQTDPWVICFEDWP